MDDERGDGATSEKPHAIHLVPFFASSCLSSEWGGRCDALMRDGGAFLPGVLRWRGDGWHGWVSYRERRVGRMDAER